MTRAEHERFEELAAGYALGALEPEDEGLFSTHVTACAACERAVDQHADTLAQLAYASPAAEPPAELLTAIRAGVQRSGREASFPQDELAAVRARRRRRLPVAPTGIAARAGVAAAAALVLGLGAWNVSLQRDVQEQGEWSGKLAQTVRALESPGTQSVPLASEDGRVLAVAVVQDDGMSLVVDGLLPNTGDTTYVLWGKSRFGDVRAVGAFDVGRPGLDVVHGMQLGQSVGEVTSFMVTQEQGETPPPVTTQPVLVSGEA